MSLIDWSILLTTISFIVIYGVYKTRKFNTIKDHLKGGGSANWLTIGLSVMATQASAITFLSTPGQAYNDGMGFVQFYFGLPLSHNCYLHGFYSNIPQAKSIYSI